MGKGRGKGEEENGVQQEGKGEEEGEEEQEGHSSSCFLCCWVVSLLGEFTISGVAI